MLEALVSSGTWTLVHFWGVFIPALGHSQIFLLHSLVRGGRTKA